MKISERAARVHEKRRKAVQLRNAGATYEEIAVAVGYANRQGAHRAVNEGLKIALREAGSEEVRALELQRLDELQKAIWTRAIGTTARPPDYDAIDRVLKIMTRRASLLGLDAAVPVVLTGEVKHEHTYAVDIHGLAGAFAALDEANLVPPMVVDAVAHAASSGDEPVRAAAHEIHAGADQPQAAGVPARDGHH